MPAAANRFLEEMLDRLYAALGGGPSLNCRPHASRQRIDFSVLAGLGDEPAERVLERLLIDRKPVKISVKPPAGLPEANVAEAELTPAQKAARRKAEAQATGLRKLRAIAEDAKSYRQDTGVHVLHVGLPLLHLPPGNLAGRAGAAKRILAPAAFVPVELAVTKGRISTIELVCCDDEAVVPNTALLAWIERQTGKPCGELGDELDSQPYRAINTIIAALGRALSLPVVEFGPTTVLSAPPRSDDPDPDVARIHPAAVLGLFPHSNQSLILDTEALVAGESLQGPIEAFVRVAGRPAEPEGHPPKRTRTFADERPVADADPCQSRAVRTARRTDMLVVHGPPGTGKSQTIANMIGDHLSRGERVLLVCDKRTALDVVHHRLDRIGLSGLCAVVHDAQADQRPLYLGVREQLDALSDAATDPGSATRLANADREMQKLHDELTRYNDGLVHRPTPDAMSFHELVGAWLDTKVPEGPEPNLSPLAELPLAEVECREHDVREILERGLDVGFATNPWATAVGIDLREFLARPMDHWRTQIGAVARAAQAADETADLVVPALPSAGDVASAGATRTAFADTLAELFRTVAPERLSHWSSRDTRAIRLASDELTAHEPALAILRSAPSDPELTAIHRADPLKPSRIAPWLLALDSYLETASRWFAFFCFAKKRAAAEVLRHFGLPLNATNATRVATFLRGIRARLALLDLHDSQLSPTPLPDRFHDEPLAEAFEQCGTVLSTLRQVESEPALMPLATAVRRAMAEPSDREALLRGLRLSSARGAAVAELERKLESAGMFAQNWIAESRTRLRGGERFAPIAAALLERSGRLEGLLHIRDRLGRLPAPLASSAAALLNRSLEVDDGWNTLRKVALRCEIDRRLRARPDLQSVDGDGLRSSFERLRTLDDRKKTLVRDFILHTWRSRQRDRLLAGTGTRLNSLGAELRRRLLLRGERALRLRQVIAVGANIEAGDPLFDLRPVWMAAPGTVAQIFPRRPLFDVVIFDEASQCRLEEALPVLLRGKRVVIAGDPKQLPPSRFFESAVAASEDDEPETDQDLFESQQSETDDLLTAALNLSVEQCHLDVHYRSRNSDLIEFSNRSFYESRLQAIPGHPSNKPFQSPLRVHRVAGIYDQRGNAVEAAYVVKLVRELLRRSEPPSIGIACFNLVQRDLITDALDEAAASDTEFASRLADARSRQGAGSFEGLFVKNLENVQGDERDMLIVSTTYGPDKKGRFHRRFGPLGRAGGGRRLNVLVTRAREEVHLITSIPSEAYRSLPPLPDGAVPNGGRLLFSYLAFAEDLDRLYERERQLARDSEPERADDSSRDDDRTRAGSKPHGTVDVMPSQCPSMFAAALARRLADPHGLSSTVHWGNDGFCVDIALRHPKRSDDVTIGILSDGSRFPKAADAVEWDLFRTRVLEATGWKLQRLWTPHFVRDPLASLQSILNAAAAPVVARS